MTIITCGKLPNTPDKLTAFTTLNGEGYNNYVIFDDVMANSDKSPLTVSTSQETVPSLGTTKKKFNTVAPDQLSPTLFAALAVLLHLSPLKKL